jgi:hypothetical protein
MASGPVCIWSSSTAAAWITITAGLSNNSGDGAVEFTVAENTLPSERSATLYVAGQEVKVTQKASPAPGSTTTSTASVSTSSVKPTTSMPASTTTTAPFCPIRNILGEKLDNILLVQEFRNTVLLNSSRGRYYVLRYYQHAPELMQIVQQNPLIRNRAAAFIQGLIPDISLLLQRKTLEISPDTIDEAIRLCDLVRAEASPALQAVIDKLKRDLSDRAFLSKLGIYISEIER